MSRNEKLLLLELLLEDIRGNCIWELEGKDRSSLALKLSMELNLPSYTSRIHEYRGQVFKNGRIFRTSVEYGGYTDMSNMHGLSRSLRGRSKEFKTLSNEYLTHPEHAFEDY
jgi:hypothetical protein